MTSSTLLVTGIHREELAFGDHVAALLDEAPIDVMRIPHGIPQNRVGTADAFYFNAQHREIYLQLRQQVRGRYRLLIDLHCGINEPGHCADIFCHDRDLLACLARLPVVATSEAPVRLVNIVPAEAGAVAHSRGDFAVTHAHTWIPREVWDDDRCTYVGLEIYLPEGDVGKQEHWRFAQRLIDAIRSCNDRPSN